VALQPVRALAAQLLDLAQRQDDPGLRQVHIHRRELPAAREQAAALYALAVAQQFPHWVAHATVICGWALAIKGQGAAGIEQLRQGLAMFQAIGSEISRTYCLAMLAAAYGTAERPVSGLQAAEEALHVGEKNGEQFYLAELYRLKAELLLTRAGGGQPQAGPRAAETCFLQSLALARRQQAKAWELRAAVSLGRLWQQQGRREAAHHLLAGVYRMLKCLFRAAPESSGLVDLGCFRGALRGTGAAASRPAGGKNQYPDTHL
jgi:adenylate cyclase